MIRILGNGYSKKELWILNHALETARKYVCDNSGCQYCEDCPPEIKRVCEDISAACFYTFEPFNPFVENPVENVEN